MGLPITLFLVAVVFSALCVAGPTTGPAMPAMPASRGGADLVGKPFLPEALTRWINGDKPSGAGTVTLYRWWTDTCPYCAASLPAIETLRKKYESAGLRVVAVYHPKPPRAVEDDAVRSAAAKIGFSGPVVIDADWRVLRHVWLDTDKRAATSVSFLVDGNGVIRFVHPGPDFFPSHKLDESRQDRDFREMDDAIRALLAERAADATTQPSR